MKGGRLIGSTEAKAERPKDHPLTPSDLHATIFRSWASITRVSFPDFAGRPTFVIEEGNAISELL